MAGLLDIFGTGGSETMGLLGMSPEAIQRNRDDAQANALYALAGRLFQGGNTGASIAQGLQAGQQAYKGTMQDTLQEQMQAYQLQELKKKREAEQQALMRQQGVENLITQAYRPQTFAETPVTNLMGQEIAGPNQPQAAGLGFESLAPKLMATKEGRSALVDLIAANKGMAGELTTLPEGANLVRIGPTGEVKTVASGAPKKEDIAGDVKEARQVLGIMTPVNEMTVTERALVKAYIDRKDAGKAPKVSVDLNDQTAVAKQKLATINQWQGTLKDTGDTTVAGRASAFYDAYGKAKQGNTSADGALIYNIAKVYDQTGAVQQGDVNTIIGNRSIPTNIQLFAEKLAKGGTFTPKERDNLKLIVDGIVEERQKALEPTIKVYRGLNSTLGGKPEEIINPYDTVRQSGGSGDLAAQARAELERRRKQ
jgi:hypothetical protein